MTSTQFAVNVAYQIMPSWQIGAVQSTDKGRFTRKAFTLSPRIYFLESEKRFDGLDMDFYRQSMTVPEFRAYLNFIGEETVDFHPSDFEVYYPDEEG